MLFRSMAGAVIVEDIDAPPALAAMEDVVLVMQHHVLLDMPAFPKDSFLLSIQSTIAAGTEDGASFTVHAPLMELSKAGIVRRAAELEVDLGLTHTCYDPVEHDGEILSCGRCDACILRLAGFREAGVEDPIPYASGGGTR